MCVNAGEVPWAMIFIVTWEPYVPLRWHHVCGEFVLYQEYRGWGREGGGEGEGICTCTYVHCRHMGLVMDMFYMYMCMYV